MNIVGGLRPVLVQTVTKISVLLSSVSIMPPILLHHEHMIQDIQCYLVFCCHLFVRMVYSNVTLDRSGYKISPCFSLNNILHISVRILLTRSLRHIIRSCTFFLWEIYNHTSILYNFPFLYIIWFLKIDGQLVNCAMYSENLL